MQLQRGSAGILVDIPLGHGQIKTASPTRRKGSKLHNFFYCVCGGIPRRGGLFANSLPAGWRERVVSGSSGSSLFLCSCHYHYHVLLRNLSIVCGEIIKVRVRLQFGENWCRMLPKFCSSIDHFISAPSYVFRNRSFFLLDNFPKTFPTWNSHLFPLQLRRILIRISTDWFCLLHNFLQAHMLQY